MRCFKYVFFALSAITFSVKSYLFRVGDAPTFGVLRAVLRYLQYLYNKAFLPGVTLEGANKREPILFPPRYVTFSFCRKEAAVVHTHSSSSRRRSWWLLMRLYAFRLKFVNFAPKLTFELHVARWLRRFYWRRPATCAAVRLRCRMLSFVLREPRWLTKAPTLWLVRTRTNENSAAFISMYRHPCCVLRWCLRAVRGATSHTRGTRKNIGWGRRTSVSVRQAEVPFVGSAVSPSCALQICSLSIALASRPSTRRNPNLGARNRVCERNEGNMKIRPRKAPRGVVPATERKTHRLSHGYRCTGSAGVFSSAHTDLV